MISNQFTTKSFVLAIEQLQKKTDKKMYLTEEGFKALNDTKVQQYDKKIFPITVSLLCEFASYTKCTDVMEVLKELGVSLECLSQIPEDSFINTVNKLFKQRTHINVRNEIPQLDISIQTSNPDEISLIEKFNYLLIEGNKKLKIIDSLLQDLNQNIGVDDLSTSKELYEVFNYLMDKLIPKLYSINFLDADGESQEKNKLMENRRDQLYIKIYTLHQNAKKYRDYEGYRQIKIAEKEVKEFLNSLPDLESKILNFENVKFLDDIIYELTQYKKKIKVIKKNFNIHSTKLNDILDRELNRVNDYTNAINSILSSPCSHPYCSASRAKKLLKNKPIGTYLIRQNPLGGLVISFINKDGRLSHHDFKVFLDGKCTLNDKDLPQNFDAFVDQMLEGIPGIPLMNIPLEHSLAQFEWNVYNIPEDQMLKQAGNGGCFITSNSLGSYTLNIVQEKGFMSKKTKLKKYHVVVQNGVITCKIKGKDRIVPSLYDLITKELGLKYHILHKKEINKKSTVEEIYYQKLLPRMQESGKEWDKASRQIYQQLPKSIWFNKNGEMYQQIHKKDFTTTEQYFVAGQDKHLRGEGGYKKIYDVVPKYIQAPSSEIVRASFINPSAEGVSENRNLLEKLKKEVNCRHLLIPNFVIYEKLNGLKVESQVMPSMVGDLHDAIKHDKLSYIGKLRAARDICQGLIDMHMEKWVHGDFKPKNILLASDDPDNPMAKISDFDFAKKISKRSKQIIKPGTYHYTDPSVMKSHAEGLNDAKLNDQFSFGATLYQLLTKSYLRTGEKSYDFHTSVKKHDLEKVRKFKHLDLRLQDIITKCCVGSNRGYHLRQILETLAILISEEEAGLNT